MANVRNNKLTNWQLFCLVLNGMVGIGVFSLAREVGAVAGKGALLAIPLSGSLVLVQLLGMQLLAGRFPQQTLREYACLILGPFLGKIYLLGYTVIVLGVAVLVLRSYWLLVSAWALLRTPQIAFLVPLVLVCWNTARRGLIVTARKVEFINYGGLALILVLMLPVLPLDGELVRPVLDTGVGGVLRGIFPTAYSLLGVDIMLIVFPFVKPKQALPVATAAVAVAVLFYTVITLYIFGTIGLELTVLTPWPLQAYLNRFASPIFERADVAFLIIWSFQIINIITINMFTATSCLRGVGSWLNEQRAALIVLVLLLIIVTIPVRFAGHAQLITVWSGAALVYLGILPFLLWLIAVVRGKRGVRQDEQESSQQVA